MSMKENIKICDKIEELSRELKDNLVEIIILENSPHPNAKKEIKILEKQNSILLKDMKEILKNIKLKKSIEKSNKTSLS